MATCFEDRRRVDASARCAPHGTPSWGRILGAAGQQIADDRDRSGSGAPAAVVNKKAGERGDLRGPPLYAKKAD